MQYDVAKAEDYLKVLDNDWRKEILNELRSLLIDKGLTETIEYKMLAFQYKGETIFHLNAQKNYVSLYVGDHLKIDPSGALLKGLDVGKGCIRFKNMRSYSQSQIALFIEKTIDAVHSGKDLSC